MMMKTIIPLAALLASANGFSNPSVPRPDASKAVQDALKITETHGINSDEAKVAWDIVEELDASDNSEATKAGLDVECGVEEEEATLECMDYGEFVDKMATVQDLVGDKRRNNNNKSGVAGVLKNVKLHSAQGAVGESSPALDAALAEARMATQQFGIKSSEAKLAWETYEDIASSGTANAMGTNLIDECDLEVGQEACEAMEELERVLPVMLAVSDKENKD